MKEIVINTTSNDSITLDVLCPECGGSGEPCTVCSKTGFVLTAEGRSIVRLIRRHLWGDGI